MSIQWESRRAEANQDYLYGLLRERHAAKIISTCTRLGGWHACSHRRITSHPARRNLALWRRSRARFSASLGTQYP
jgi:hypothetical protein